MAKWYDYQMNYSDGELEKAKIIILGNQEETIEVLFNPEQYNIKRGAKYEEKSSSQTNTPNQNYAGGNSTELSVSLFFDTSSKINSKQEEKAATDVTLFTRKFMKLVEIEEKEKAPPRVKFAWGSLSFVGVIISINTTYTMFTEFAMPVRAKLDMVLKAVCESEDIFVEIPHTEKKQAKCQMVKADASIWNIAQQEYGDASKWRVIAKENEVENPLAIPNGTELKVPAS